MRIRDVPQSATYIAGIYGSAVGGNGVAVYVDSNGQLGTTGGEANVTQLSHRIVLDYPFG